MGNLKNAALYWCKIKRYVAMFLAVVSGLLLVLSLLNQKPPKNADEAKTRKQVIGFLAVMCAFSVFGYFFLQTNIGCGLSIAGNAYRLFH
jgi:uncharacterized membrane protein